MQTQYTNEEETPRKRVYRGYAPPIILPDNKTRNTEDDPELTEYDDSSLRYHQPVTTRKVNTVAHKSSATGSQQLVLAMGGGMILMLLLWCAVNAAVTWVHTTLDTLHYGYPRTYQIDAVVGHSDSSSSPSHFIAINLNRRVVVLEFPGGDSAHSTVYNGLAITGDNQNLTPVTLTFKDVNGDGKLDMIVNVANTHYVYINTGSQFKPTNTNF